MDGEREVMFWFIAISLGLLIKLNHAATYSCLDENGDAVDWYARGVLSIFCLCHAFRFVVYKLPELRNHPNSNVKRGLGYLYLDSRNIAWTIGSNSIGSSNCAVGRTIGQIYSSKSDPVRSANIF